MEQFRNIGLIGRLGGGALIVDTLKKLKKFLVAEGLTVILEENTASAIPGHGLEVTNQRLLGELCDLVIVVGGDGSLLGAARSLAKYHVPVLGVNRGRLGFLTDISPNRLEQQIAQVLAGDYETDTRFLLGTRIRRDNKTIATGASLNDVVLHPGKSVKMIEFELYVDNEFVYSQRSDGIIIATPTGSTAYALSGGGPILHPKLDAIVLVPMFPHTLSSRPIVLAGHSQIKIVIGSKNTTYPQVNCDGQNEITLAPGDLLYIDKKPQTLNLIHPPGHNFYYICRTKLGWGRHLGQDES
jgi:NAD+ kinase